MYMFCIVAVVHEKKNLKSAVLRQLQDCYTRTNGGNSSSYVMHLVGLWSQCFENLVLCMNS